MVDPLPATYFVWAIAAHPRWALLAAGVYVFCALVIWQCEIPRWVAAVILMSLVLVFTVVGFVSACMTGSIVIG